MVEENNKWVFAQNDNSQFQGIGNTGVNLFKGTPIKSLAREICQNSLDARLDVTKPVRVEFKSFKVETSEFPAIESLKTAFKEKLDFALEKNLIKASDTLRRMIPSLENSNITILRISDFNTKGLEGADGDATDIETPWFRLVRSEGNSDKTEGSMGSYGSGHLAVYATSTVSTVMYSTMDCTDKHIEASEGVARLMAHIKDGHQYSDVGYLGSNGTSMPIMQQLNLDKSFTRKEPGTDVYSVAFRFKDASWKKELIGTILDGFFFAIMENNLEVDAEGTLINSDNLGKLMQEYKEYIDPKTLDYYGILANPQIEIERKKMYEDNDIELSMQIKPGLCKRVAIIRWPGMKIFDRGYISPTVPFAGVCVIKGEKISDLFRGLENIEHTKWQLSRYDDFPEKRKEADKRQSELFEILKDKFYGLLGDAATEKVDPDIGDCLPDPFSDKEKEKPTLTDELEEFEIKKSKIPNPTNEGEGDDDGRGSKAEPSPEPPTPHPPYPGPVPPIPGPEPGPNPTPGPNPENPKKTGKLKAVSARIRSIGKGVGSYKVIIKPVKAYKNGYAKIMFSAETGNYDATVTGASINGENISFEGCRIDLPDAQAGEKVVVEIKVRHKEMRPLEVKVFGNQV